MIALSAWLVFLAAAAPAVPAASSTAAPSETQFAQLAPAAVLAHYTAALHKLKEPHVFTFDYTLEQTGARTLEQTHRVFRSGSNERDETLTVDGKRLSPPTVRVFRGRRNRYTVSGLAPRPGDYAFSYVGSRRDGHHVDYLFHLTPKAVRPFAVTDVTIDGVRFLPLSIDFKTSLKTGAGSITFGGNARWWVPYVATARARVADDVAAERLTFYTYRFPPALPESTFAVARRPVPHALAPEIPAAAPARADAPPADDQTQPETPVHRLPTTAPDPLRFEH